MATGKAHSSPKRQQENCSFADENVTDNVSHYTSSSKDQSILLTGHFPVANTPCEIPDLCVRVTISELMLLEYSQGLVN